MEMPQAATVKKLLVERSVPEVRALGVEALRAWRRSRQGRDGYFSVHGQFGVEFGNLLNRAAGNSANVDGAKEVFLANQADPELRAFVEFLWWLVRAGLAYPQAFDQRAIISLGLTEAGLRFLDADADHPLAPGFVERLRGRHPGIPANALVLLEDAHRCLEVRLLRPAVVLLGVSFETTIEELIAFFEIRAVFTSADRQQATQAGQRLALLRPLFQNRLRFTPAEGKRLSLAALDFADHVRVRRSG